MAKLADLSSKIKVGTLLQKSFQPVPTYSNQVGSGWNKVGINPTDRKQY